MLKKELSDIIDNIKKKKSSFNESLSLIYNIKLKNNFSTKTYFILPKRTGRVIKFVSFIKKNEFIKENKVRSTSDCYVIFHPFGDRSILDKVVKNYSVFHFDTLSFEAFKREGIISIFIKKKKKVGYCYGNVSDDVGYIHRIISQGRLVSLNLKCLSKVLNPISVTVGTLNSKTSDILDNIESSNINIYKILRSSNNSSRNIISVFIKSTQGKVFRL